MFTIFGLVFCLLLSAFAKANGIICLPTIAIVGFIILISIAYSFDISKSRVFSKVKTGLLIGYFWRLFLVFFDLYCRNIFTLPGSGVDSETFYARALLVMNGGENTLTKIFVDLIATFFSWFGTSRLFLQFCLMLLSIVAIHFTVLMMEQLEVPERNKRISILILGLLPNFAILSSILLRESVIAMLLSISIYLFVIWFKRGNMLFFIGAVFLALFASRFHGACGVIIIGYFINYFLYDTRRKVFRTSFGRIIITIILSIGFLFLYINYGDVFFGKMASISSLSDIADGSSDGGSSYAKYVGDSSNPIRMVIFTLPRLIFYMFSPFPWQWRGLSDIIAFVFSSCFYAFVLFCVIKYFREERSDNRNIIIALCIVAFVVWFVFAWGISNTGTAIRHRDKVIVLYVVLLALTYKSDSRILIENRNYYNQNRYKN